MYAPLFRSKYIKPRVKIIMCQALIRPILTNFIIKLIKYNILRYSQCIENNLILAPYYADYKYLSKSLETWYIPLEAFIYIDNENMLQNEDGIPIDVLMTKKLIVIVNNSYIKQGFKIIQQYKSQEILVVIYILNIIFSCFFNLFFNPLTNPYKLLR